MRTGGSAPPPPHHALCHVTLAKSRDPGASAASSATEGQEYHPPDNQGLTPPSTPTCIITEVLSTF